MIGITMPDEGEVWLFGETVSSRAAQPHRLSARGTRPLQANEGPRSPGLPRPPAQSLRAGSAQALAGLVRAAADRANGRRRKWRSFPRACSRRFSSSRRCCTIPTLVIMDEPFSGLDPANSVMLKDVLHRYEESRQDHPLLHPSHGPGGAALRVHLPDRSRPRRFWRAI